MCIIIDANVAHYFTLSPHEDALPVKEWLTRLNSSAKVVIGGKLSKELGRAGGDISRFLDLLKSVGRLIIVSDADAEKETEVVTLQLKMDGLNTMDDPHIIALARLSGSRLLFSRDHSSRLHEVFKSRVYLEPPGKIYQTREHVHLLRKSPKCKRPSVS